MLILGIETSCDETSAAVVKDGREIVSSIILSQDALHRQFGGVVPEIACRAHLESIIGIVNNALSDAKVQLAEIDAIAVVKGMWERAENPAMRKGLAANLATLRKKRAALRASA